jgi:ABC-type nitrate/sulfonate/bicarbonate transport system substrate-binding protein
MSKKHDKQNGTTPATMTVDGETENASTPEVETPAKPKATKEQLKALFAAYEKVDAEYEKTAAELAKIKERKSVATKAILDAAGKGPYSYKGDELTISQREDTFFFRGKKKDRETIQID